MAPIPICRNLSLSSCFWIVICFPVSENLKKARSQVLSNFTPDFPFLFFFVASSIDTLQPRRYIWNSGCRLMGSGAPAASVTPGVGCRLATVTSPSRHHNFPIHLIYKTLYYYFKNYFSFKKSYLFI